jgi:hypothetical protein
MSGFLLVGTDRARPAVNGGIRIGPKGYRRRDDPQAACVAFPERGIIEPPPFRR